MKITKGALKQMVAEEMRRGGREAEADAESMQALGRAGEKVVDTATLGLAAKQREARRLAKRAAGYKGLEQKRADDPRRARRIKAKQAAQKAKKDARQAEWDRRNQAPTDPYASAEEDEDMYLGAEEGYGTEDLAMGPYKDEEEAKKAKAAQRNANKELREFRQKGKTKMKLTKNTLKRLIKEELGALTSEDKKARDAIERWNELYRNEASYEKHSPWLARNPTRTAQLLDLTDEEEDYETARELERATDAGEPITPEQEAAATAARDLPRRAMSQKAQDPGVKRRARAIARKAAAVQESKQRKNLKVVKNMIRSEIKKLR